MDIDYKVNVSLEKCEKEAIQILADVNLQCISDERLSCEDCPFTPKGDYSCIPYLCNELKEEIK